jgi:putative ubiquitin-RnfH superfamily antitoxin RatB of RatAB toxin-antitoxin module
MAGAEAALHIEVLYSPVAGEVRSCALRLPSGACVGDAVRATGWFPTVEACEASGLRVGVWGQLKGADSLLRDRDRVELYRPLQVDPKQARRLRYQRHKESLAARSAVQAKRAPRAKKAPG